MGNRLSAKVLQDSRWNRLVLYLILMTLCLTQLFSVRFLPFSDYHQWVFQGHLLRVHQDDPAAVAEYFTWAHSPVPNSAFPAVAWLLGKLSSDPEGIAKAFLAVAIVVYTLGASYLIRSVQGRPTAVEILPFIWSYGYYVYNGFLSYHLSLGLFFLSFGYLHRATKGGNERPPALSVLVLMVLSIITYFSHLFGWLPLCIAVAAYAVRIIIRQRDGKSAWLMVSLVPALLLLAWYSAEQSDALNLTLYDSIPNKLSSFVGPLLLFFRLDPFDIQAPAPFILNSMVGLIVLALLVSLACRTGRRYLPISVHRAPFLVGFALLLCTTLIPFSWFGGMGGPDQRFMQPAFWTLVAAVCYRPRTWKQEAILVPLVVSVLLVNGILFAQAQPRLKDIFETTRRVIPKGENVYAVSLRNPPIWNSCSQQTAMNLTVGIHTVQWFDLYRFVWNGGLHATIFDSSVLIPRQTNTIPHLAIAEFPRTDLEAAAEVILEADHYQFVEVFGCLTDLEEVEQLLFPAFTVRARGLNFLVLSRG